MTSTDVAQPPISPFEREARAALDVAEHLGVLGQRGSVTFSARKGPHNLWIVATIDDRIVAALRAGYAAGVSAVTLTESADGFVLDAPSDVGAWRTKVTFPSPEAALVRCSTSLIPAADLAVPFWPRDLIAGAPSGTVYAAQRGLRSGIVFAATELETPCSLFYFQDFSSLSDYFSATGRTPADTVGGSWPELGYAPPGGDGACILPKSRETVISDAYLTVRDEAPRSDAEVAAMYLDLLAETYTSLPRPPVEYHDWPRRAERTVRDLSLSPACTDIRRGRRYLIPYVNDRTKPPESMVQMTVGVNLLEYDAWSGRDTPLTAALCATAASFFDESIGSVVRWLPGEPFVGQMEDTTLNHDDMDSWYLHHTLFNLSRLATHGNETAKDLLRRSLPYVMRVAQRFAYRWPIFFDLHTLDVVRAEAAPGQGGENDVAGLYGLLMLHAHELFGDAEYLAEAERAVRKLEGLGLNLGYQMNTTGFAAEAAMRLWKKTRNRAYLALSEICMANLFDNMWLWQCGYGSGPEYRTFFGLFPLRDAPYLAAYEELEAHAKFHEYLALGGDDVRPSLRLLLAESQRYAVDRCWYYFPESLPRAVLAEQVRNGTLERDLAIPVEDLQDGRERSGQVGQEIYGAGAALVMTSRHYAPLSQRGFRLYCNYPMYDLQPAAGGFSFRVDGDAQFECEVRIIPHEAEVEPLVFSLRDAENDLPGTLTPEGHAAFTVRAGRTFALRWTALGDAPPYGGVEIGGIARSRS